MADEFTLLLPQDTEEPLPQDAEELLRLKNHRRRWTNCALIITITCPIFILCACLFYLRFSTRLVDEGRLTPPRGIKFNCSIPTAPEFRPPLRTEGRHILDALNTRVRLKSVNWYGASDINYVPSGLDIRHRDEISALIRCIGFNTVRLPYSDEMVRSNPLIPAKHILANPDLIGQHALDIFTSVVQSLTGAGVSVVINNHITQATWCCGINPCDTGWANDWLGHLCRVPQTENSWIENLETIMRLFENDRLVIGADLRNEVRGLWGTMSWKSWAATAERAAEALLRINQEWLIVVEGTSSANDLSRVKERPVQLSIPGRVVYSAHVYSWSGWGQLAPYWTTSYNEFVTAMRKNWAYLVEEEAAVVWVGEFGNPDRPSDGDLNYWKHLIQLLTELDADWGYWAINPRKPARNEGESYGLVKDDWETVRWDYRMQDLLKLGLKSGQMNNETEQA
jgi:endoglucanase